MIVVARYRFWIQDNAHGRRKKTRTRKVWPFGSARANPELNAQIERTMNKADWDFMAEHIPNLEMNLRDEERRAWSRLVFYRAEDALDT